LRHRITAAATKKKKKKRKKKKKKKEGTFDLIRRTDGRTDGRTDVDRFRRAPEIRPRRKKCISL
jgi:hypothetical protein